MSHEPLPVFISYASYDNKSGDPEQRWLDRLLQFLKPLDLDQKTSLWNDTELQVGANWRGEIRKAIDRAKVAILLVSPAFLASDFIRTDELPKLLQNANPDHLEGMDGDDTSEGMLILPILLRPCLVHYARFEVRNDVSEVNYARLSDFQYVPKGGAMNGLSQFDQDKQFEAIAQRIIDVLEIRTSEPITTLPNSERDQIEDLLVSFLTSYNKWWFNALRIQNWGAKQKGFQDFGNYTVQQLSSILDALVEAERIRRKDGKKSLVYKA